MMRPQDPLGVAGARGPRGPTGPEAPGAPSPTGPRTPPDSFEARYRADPDPWGFASNPYERAKYARTVGTLGDRRFSRALELGCANGELTALLAPRCDRLLAVDAAPSAVARAGARLRGARGVEVRRALLPEQLPREPWELVVASEVLYYLGGELLELLVAGLLADLRPGGLLLTVHWTGEAASHPLSADAVHERLLAEPALRSVTSDRHAGYRLDLLEAR